MKATVNTTSATSPQHLVHLLFDPGGYFNVQESWSTNQGWPPPPKPPDRSFYSVSSFLYNNVFAKEMFDYSAIWTLFFGFASIDYVQVLSQIPYLLQSDLHFNFYAFNFGWVYSAQKVFAEMSGQSVASWLTFIQKVLINTYGWEVYTSLSLDLCKTYAFSDASKYCIFSDYSQAWSLIKCAHECKIPWQYENNHQVGLLKKFDLNAPTNELVCLHDQHLMVLSPNHYNLSKLVRNVDLVHSLLLDKYEIVLVAFLVNGEISCDYYSIGCNDEPRPIILTLKCSPTLGNLRLRSYTNDTMALQYYQIPINGLEEDKAKLITIEEDFSEALIVQSIRVKHFVHNYFHLNLLDKDACFDIFICSLEGHCVVALISWQWLIPSTISHEYWEYLKNFYNLEDKVSLHRVDSDIIHVVWIPCVLAWMIYDEVTTIKAVEIMEEIKYKKIVRLKYCSILLDGNLVVAFGVTNINGCEPMHIIVRHCGCTSQVKMEKWKKWDPGGHVDMRTTTWCEIPETADEVKAKLRLRQEGAIKRDRAMAYSISTQSRISASPNSKATTKSITLLKHHHNLDYNKSLGNSLLERWMLTKPCPWESPISSRKSEKLVLNFQSRRNGVTTRISTLKICLQTPSSSTVSSKYMNDDSLISTSCTSESSSMPFINIVMVETTWSTKFKQWDPGKFCVVSNFHNLEDKVDFEGVSNVMILEAQIMSSTKVKGSGDSSTF
jgi:hypothetical protein